ncbi:hypothetical protein EYF80_017538 [Liparis tanakae]|uniref:Uncharacterized protein n=1 Tax=Liparis tanakae TaxID=230148 RepID=A0A4Z2I4M7_9TELE|nr:hypothetical protein EYF80_017538 [Liparis tanakae]
MAVHFTVGLRTRGRREPAVEESLSAANQLAMPVTIPELYIAKELQMMMDCFKMIAAKENFCAEKGRKAVCHFVKVLCKGCIVHCPFCPRCKQQAR